MRALANCASAIQRRGYIVIFECWLGLAVGFLLYLLMLWNIAREIFVEPPPRSQWKVPLWWGGADSPERTASAPPKAPVLDDRRVSG